jgi:hypothetical protein
VLVYPLDDGDIALDLESDFVAGDGRITFTCGVIIRAGV